MKSKIFLVVIFLLGLVLRLYNLASIPPSLYWDEASLGYNAYTISQNLRDEHGIFLPLTNFPAFGDYKPPGYIYATAAFVKVLGLNEFSVRLPSALAGAALVIITYFLTLELLFLLKKFQISNFKFQIAQGAALLVAISPWSLQMSRAAFEANFATFLTALGACLFLKALRLNKTTPLILCALPFSLAIYTFNSHRVFVPILIAGLILIFFRKFLRRPKMLIIFLVTLALLNAPLIPHLSSKEGRLRFEEVTWLNDLDLVKESNNQIASHGNTLLAKIIYNRRVFYSREFIKHYLDHYNPQFLFISGDVNSRLSTQAVGELYVWDGIFLLAGLIFLIRFRSKMTAVILLWFFTAPIPASVARETPHALRTLNILPMPQIIVTLGLSWLAGFASNKIILKTCFALVVAVLYAYSFHAYISNYYLTYPKKYSDSWQYGYKQLVEYVSTVENKYDHISITNLYGRPYIYFLFYKQYPLDKYLKSGDVSVDQFGFYSVRSFDKYVFSDNTSLPGKWLYVKGPSKGPINSGNLKIITDLNGKTVFEISENK